MEIKQNNRPRLFDPEEFALIKSIYFEKDLPAEDDTDPIERLERQESRQRNLNKSPR